MASHPVRACRATDSLLGFASSQRAAHSQDCYGGERRGREWKGNTTVTGQPDAELDLRGVICPYNFVKTKLKLEAMEQGQILSVLLDDGDPIRNVPRSVSNEGHTILSEDRVEGSYRVVIRRREDE
jgi:tRNA 2-thiouridine synthesizing protein A